MDYFERDDDVLVRTHTGSTEKGTVVLDTGSETIVVTRNDDPALSRRVARADVSEVNGTAQPPLKTKPLAPKKKRRPAITLTSLKCLETEKGWCAMQMQARPVTQADLISGVYTLCSAWVSTRIKPTRREPTCATCRERLNMPAQGAP
jgi:hypothetical protein